MFQLRFSIQESKIKKNMEKGLTQKVYLVFSFTSFTNLMLFFLIHIFSLFLVQNINFCVCMFNLDSKFFFTFLV